MPKIKFKRIGLISRFTEEAKQTLTTIVELLEKLNVEIIFAANTAKMLDEQQVKKGVAEEDLGRECDLVIVIGGDGTFLKATRLLVNHDVAVAGVNQGTLGFLVDINPQEVATKITAILNGKYYEETRLLLSATATQNNKFIGQGSCLNEITVTGGNPAYMMEFEIYVNNNFMCSQRSNGVIIATPTGSTAYALSGGGPIIHPNVDGIVIVPMFPHTLSFRPLVIGADSVIDIVPGENLRQSSLVHADSRICAEVVAGGKITIRKHAKTLRLIHPIEYDYFAALRTKLEWGRKL